MFSWRRRTTRPPRRSGRASWRRRHGRRMSRGHTGKGGSVAGQTKRRCKSRWEGRRGRQGSVCLPDSVLSPLPCWQRPCGHLRTGQLPSALALTSCLRFPGGGSHPGGLGWRPSLGLSFGIFLFQPQRKQGADQGDTASRGGRCWGGGACRGPIWCYRYLRSTVLHPRPLLWSKSGMGVNQLWSLPVKRGELARPSLVGRGVTRRYKVPSE